MFFYLERRTYLQLLLAGVFIAALCNYQEAHGRAMPYQQIQQDTTAQDSIPPYQPSETPVYKPSYRFGDPFSNQSSRSPLQLNDPSSVELQVEFDSSVNYSVYERVGGVNFRPVTSMTFQEYDRYNDAQITKDYFRERSAGLDGESAVSGRSLIPRLYISPVLDRLFGGSYVDIQPNGFVNLDFGGRFQRVDNPALPLRAQRNGGFNFDQQISLNLVGKVGEKLAVTANFDNNNTFDFQNNLKVEYTGYEEDIVKKIEIGNVSMPVSNSLMTGGQSLFGVKTQLQFGKLFVTGVVTRQQGSSEVLTLEQGVEGREFSVRAHDYDDFRHFFLGHFFRDNYERWLSTLPQVNSGVFISRVEVYVVNRTNNPQTNREIVGLIDLGEGRVLNKNLWNAQGQGPNRNEANNLFDQVTDLNRNTSAISEQLIALGLENGTDFERNSSSRKLDESEYVVDRQLGYISLRNRINEDEMLAVAYEYNYGGDTYTVGELSEDYGTLADDEVAFLKLLKSKSLRVDLPTWELMMKNIYSITTGQVQRDGFTLRVHYRDDATGIDNPSLHEGAELRNRPLVEILGLDRLNRNNDNQSDGNFDYIEGVTINPQYGNIIFPVLEPFGSALRRRFRPDEGNLAEKYVYNELYEIQQSQAENAASKNKFFIEGKYSASSGGSSVSLRGIKIAEGSVVVTAGSRLLTEGLDYRVDYNIGQLTFLNDAITSSGQTINISYEKADLFNFQSKWLYGARADYRFNENFNIGATIMHLNEQPGGISRFTIGDEPTKNTKYGFDINYQEEMPILTKAMDLLPLVSTKEVSNISFNAEFAQMVPGTSNLVDGKGTSYIDDFEYATNSINIKGWEGWDLAATPETDDDRFDLRNLDPLGENFRRGKLAWFDIDQTAFYRGSGLQSAEIKETELDNNYVRPVEPQEIFQRRDRNVVQLPENFLHLAYYPDQRGQYNYNPEALTGRLSAPEKNYGGITRAITTQTNFLGANMQYIEFWMMDPFIDGPNGRAGIFPGYTFNDLEAEGELVFNLGDVSEDVVPDESHAFESGYPEDGNQDETKTTLYGRVPDDPIIVNNFINDRSARQNQDIGLDGLNDDGERQKFTNYSAQDDPSADNFRYFLGNEFDSRQAGILERYYNFNGLEGNSPVANSNTPRAATTLPDNEDLNKDFTLQTAENYFEYTVPLRKGNIADNPYVVDQVDGANGARWFLFRIPIANPTDKYKQPDLSTIKFVRMYLTKFKQPVLLRMTKFQFVSSQWWEYTETSLKNGGLDEIQEKSDADIAISVVNIEDNGSGEYPYNLPPGIRRDRDNVTPNNRQFNEQSVQVCIEDLKDGDARAIFKKSLELDLINYGSIQMFMHLQPSNGEILQDDEISGFLRMGTDGGENYYEIEVPLKVSPSGTNAPLAVWPAENDIDISLDELLALKALRSRQGISESASFTTISDNGKYQLTVKGRPDMSSIQTLLIGARNNTSIDQESKSFCFWANELRVTDFDDRKGWAANARLSTKLADVATITASTTYTSIGFGNIQQTIQQRTRAESIDYGVSASVNLHKFLLPEKTGLSVPMYVSLDKGRSIPQYDPLDPDVPLEASLRTIESQEERNRYRKLVEDRTVTRSINFTNVRKTKVDQEADLHFYDIENLSVSYAYSDAVTSNITTETYLQKSVSGGVSYDYSPKAVVLEPFAKSKAFKSPYLKLIKDVNLSLLPSSLSFRADLNRNFRKTQLYNDQLEIDTALLYFERLFTFTRNYGLRWSIFKSLNLDYNARVNAVIDEPDQEIEGDINTEEEKQFIWDQVKSLGRMKHFDQNISATYKLPLNKFPLTDWVSADIKYAAGYSWTAGAIGDSLFFGNTIQNQRDRGISGKLDMVKLYNKVKFLKEANTPPRRQPANKKNDEEDESKGPGLSKHILRFLMSVRSINASYNVRESTMLTGLNQSPALLGMDSSWNAPGWGFLLGSQNPDIRTRASDNDWLVREPSLTSPFQQTFDADLGIKATLEPAQYLKIQLDAQRKSSASYQEIYRVDTTSSTNLEDARFRSQPTSRRGSYSVSFFSLNTAFGDISNKTSSKSFDQFVQEVGRVQALRGSGYDSLSQDVLVPSFITAYRGKESSNNFTPFPKIPLPGWRLDYSGLSKVPALEEVFSSVTVSHGYRSLYTVNDYTFNLSDYKDRLHDPNGGLDVRLNNNILDYPDATVRNDEGRLMPVYILNQVSISEQFSPLIGVNIRTKNNITARVELKKDRNLSLNVSNAQITETRGQDFVLDFGYTNDSFKLPFKLNGRTVTLDNTINFKLNMTLRDTETIQRKIEGDSQVTNGNKNFQLRPSFTYKINNQLDLSFYFERTVNQPKVSSFKTSSTAFGTQLRFSLAQ